MRRIMIIGAVLAGGLALAGCAPSEEPSDQPPVPGTPPPATAQHIAGEHAEGENAAAESVFAQQLLANRQQVVELAQLAGGNAEDAELKTVATELQQEAESQVQRLTTFLKSQQPGSETETIVADFQQLSQLSGAEFDAQWKQAMLSLQQGATQLAHTEQTEGSTPELRELAEEIVAAEQETTAKLNALG